jgi:ankyrin repeat protein
MNSSASSEMIKIIIDYYDDNNWDVIIPESSKNSDLCLAFIVCENINSNDNMIRYIVDHHIKSGVPINKATQHKTQLIHFVCKNKNTSDETIIYVINECVKHQHNIDEKNDEGYTPFSYACRHASMKVVSYFMEKEIDCMNTIPKTNGSDDIYTLMKNNPKINKNYEEEHAQMQNVMNLIIDGISRVVNVEGTTVDESEGTTVDEPEETTVDEPEETTVDEPEEIVTDESEDESKGETKEEKNNKMMEQLDMIFNLAMQLPENSDSDDVAELD